MINIAFFTGTRADFGLLELSVKKLNLTNEFNAGLIVGGNHFDKKFGLTVDSIIDSELPIWGRIEFEQSTTDVSGSINLMALTLVKAASILETQKPDYLVILGDRFEAMAIAQTAFMLRIPIIHLHAGEMTIGALDDFFRHAITQFSTFAITATERYSLRCIQLGMPPNKVETLGSPGIDQLSHVLEQSRAEFLDSIEWPHASSFMLLTIHPETQQLEETNKLINTTISAINKFEEINVLVTYPNADPGHEHIITAIEAWARQCPERIKVVPNLGQLRYVNAVRHACVVVGNSSSGIIEVPSLNTPTVNIGNRQSGRLHASSVVNAEVHSEDIESAIRLTLSAEFLENKNRFSNPYGETGFSDRFVTWITQKCVGEFEKSSFYDLPEKLLQSQKDEQ